MKTTRMVAAMALAIATVSAAAATGDIVGSPTIIDGVNGGIVLESAISGNPDGSVAAVWLVENATSNLREIRFQTFSASGNPVGPYEVAAGPAPGLAHPTVLSRADGAAFVAWQASGVDGDGTAIMLRRLNWSDESVVVVNQSTMGDQQFPALALSRNGENLLVTWDTPAAEGGRAAMARAYSGNYGPDLPTSNEFRINPIAAPNPTRPIAVPSDYDFKVFWLGRADANSTVDRVLQLTYTHNGTQVSPEPEIYGDILAPSANIDELAAAPGTGYGQTFVALGQSDVLYTTWIPYGESPVVSDGMACRSPKLTRAWTDLVGLLMECEFESRRMPFVGYSQNDHFTAYPFLSGLLPAEAPGTIKAGGLALDADGNALIPVIMPAGTGGFDSALALVRLRGARQIPMEVGIFGPDSVMLGQTSTYTVWINNNASGYNETTQQLKGLNLTIQLPEGSQYQLDDLYNWTCTGSSVLNCQYAGTLQSSRSVYIRLIVDSPPVAGELTLNASVTSSVNAEPNVATANKTTVIIQPDQSPTPFSLPTLNPVAVATTYTAVIDVSGVNTDTPIVVQNGRFSVNGGSYYSGTGLVRNGDRVSIEHVSASNYATTTATMVTIGDQNASMTSTTGPEGTTPAAFHFTDLMAVQRNRIVQSESVTITGLSTESPISIINGSYSVNGGPFQTEAGLIGPGASVRVQHLASAEFNTQIDTTLTIGGISDTFSSTTVLMDDVPNSFGWLDNPFVPRATLVSSEVITLSGFNTVLPITIDNGSYSINYGPFTSAPGSVSANDKIRVQHLSAPTFRTASVTTVTVGTVSGTFTSVVEPEDAEPNTLFFSDVTNVPRSTLQISNPQTITGINTTVTVQVFGGDYSINGGSFINTPSQVKAGDVIRCRHLSSAQFSEYAWTTLQFGSSFYSFRSTTVAADMTPDPVVFTPVDNVSRSTLITSNPVTVSGIDAPISISTINGSYSVNGGPFVSTLGSVVQGDIVLVQHQSSANFASATTTSLRLNGAGYNFTSTTEAMDTTPNAFDFPDLLDVALSSTQTSAAVVITGINAPSPISVSNGSYSINAGPFVSTAGSVNVGDAVSVRHTSAAAFATAVSTVLTIGGVDAAFSSTTEAADSTPNSFAFAAQTGLATNVTASSQSVTISGINVPVTVTVSGGSYAINGGAFTTAAGTIHAGDQVQVRLTTASTASTASSATLSIGGINASFTATTGTVDSTPSAFTFTSVVNARRNRAVTSNTITVGGINTSVPITVAGSGAVKYSKNGGAFTASAGTVVSGDQIRLQLTASSAANTTLTATATIGGVSATWNVTSGTR